jgi:methylase of polypeptide subunit release factors
MRFLLMENGLINYRKIISGLNNFLKSENKIFLEIGFNQAEDCNQYPQRVPIY